jgi:hypothetical protein
MSEEEKKILQTQDQDRRRMDSLLRGDFLRTLDSIRCLCSSDIEVGNSCLPVVSRSVLRASVSCCPAVSLFRLLKDRSFEVLTVLCTCVYEISEVHAPTLASALTICCRNEGDCIGKDKKTNFKL